MAGQGLLRRPGRPDLHFGLKACTRACPTLNATRLPAQTFGVDTQVDTSRTTSEQREYTSSRTRETGEVSFEVPAGSLNRTARELSSRQALADCARLNEQGPRAPSWSALSTPPAASTSLRSRCLLDIPGSASQLGPTPPWISSELPCCAARVLASSETPSACFAHAGRLGACRGEGVVA